MKTALVSSKGAIVIPKELRKKYSIEPGCKIQLLDMHGTIQLKALPENTISYARGFLKKKNKSVMDMLREGRELDKKHDDFLTKNIKMNE